MSVSLCLHHHAILILAHLSVKISIIDLGVLIGYVNFYILAPPAKGITQSGVAIGCNILMHSRNKLALDKGPILGENKITITLNKGQITGESKMHFGVVFTPQKEDIIFKGVVEEDPDIKSFP